MKIQNIGNKQLPKVFPDVIVPILNSKSKLWLKPTDQMDTWLDSQGFYRKHIARDASSLFRCVSEQIFLTQVYHLTVRKHCIQFALNQPDVFQKLSDIPVKEYVDRLYNQREWGNTLDMEIMSLLYNVDFAIYKEIKKPLEKVTSNGFRSYIVLSLSYEHHYDSVYPKQHIINAAICQSILYEILYKYIFKLEEVDYAVSKMLHDKTSRCQTEINVALFNTGFQMRLEMRDNCRNVKDLLNCGITPFPYKVAKSLDPNIYRNVEYDTWNEQRKGLRHGLITWSNRELQVGSRCVINFNEQNKVIRRHGYIQQMTPNKGPVLVFVEEIGEKLTVSFESLEVLPLPSNSSNQSEETASDYHTELSLVNELRKTNTNHEESVENNYHNLQIKIEEKNDQVPNQDICNVHYVHPVTTAVPTTCYSCITSQNSSVETNIVKAGQVFHFNTVENHQKINSDFQHEVTNVGQTAQISMQYPAPLYSTVSQDINQQQQATVSNYLPNKTTNVAECNDGNQQVHVMYNNGSVDTCYRYGLPYCMVPPNYIIPLNPEHSIQQTNDIQRINYTASAFPISPAPNELLYALPVTNMTNKAELPLYPTQIIYPPRIKKSTRNIPGYSEYTNIDSMYRPKEMIYIKDPVSINTPSLPNVSTNIYPLTYPSLPPPVFYHSYDYCGACPGMQPYDNLTSVYQVPQMVPITYTDEVYQSNGQIICHPLLPNQTQ